MLFLAHQKAHKVSNITSTAVSSSSTVHHARRKRKPFGIEWRMPVWSPARG